MGGNSISAEPDHEHNKSGGGRDTCIVILKSPLSRFKSVNRKINSIQCSDIVKEKILNWSRFRLCVPLAPSGHLAVHAAIENSPDLSVVFNGTRPVECRKVAARHSVFVRRCWWFSQGGRSELSSLACTGLLYCQKSEISMSDCLCVGGCEQKADQLMATGSSAAQLAIISASIHSAAIEKSD